MQSLKTCFIIDDDPDDQEFFKEAVKEIDSRIICYSAVNGEEGIEKLKEGLPVNPDIIFIDLNMPKLNGKQCLIEIKKMVEYDQTPLVIYSTSSQTQDIEETRELGASYFLTKPSTYTALVDKLTYILKGGFLQAGI